MLRRLSLADVAIAHRLEFEPVAGFTVLTGETGAGKSILVDALQLALGARGDSTLVREGAARAEVSAEFDAPDSLRPWLADGGFGAADEAAGDAPLLLRRTLDREGRSRAWINGHAATVAQLREAAEHLVEIHGQHAWQRLARPAEARALLDARAGTDTAALAAAFQRWKAAAAALEAARASADTASREREHLAWQLAEVERLAPREGEWAEIEAEHTRLAHGEGLLAGARAALEAIADGDPSADALLARATAALEAVAAHDASLDDVIEALRGASAAAQDAARTLGAYLNRSEPDPARLAALEARMSAWLALARRHRRPAAELPALHAAWGAELAQLDAAADIEGLQRAVTEALAGWQHEAARARAGRERAAPQLAAAVTLAMQGLAMAGGRFEVVLVPATSGPQGVAPQAHGSEAIEFRVAGHAGAEPRAIGKVASGGELSRLALAIAVVTSGAGAEGEADTAAPTLVFDEIDSGIGGQVADEVGRLLKALGSRVQVLAVTHLAQVAACAEGHFTVGKSMRDGRATSELVAVSGEARVAEIARMLGGGRLAGTSRAHAAALLSGAARTEDTR
jgi:DNA repair protein RecN (Recombination protein N)